jgi:hypothetical protein
VPAPGDISSGSNNHDISGPERVNSTINMLILLRFTVNSGMCKAAKQNNKNFASDFYGFHLSVQNKTPSQTYLQLLLWTILSIKNVSHRSKKTDERALQAC